MKITKQSPKLAASSLMSVVLIAAALLVSGVLTARAQQDGNAGVVPPNATFYGNLRRMEREVVGVVYGIPRPG